MSVENARANLKAENPGWDFDSVRTAAEQAWNKRLSLIEVEGSDYDRTVQFYTHLYHAFMHPNLFSDVNGEYMGADGKIHVSSRPVYTNFSNWDTYRTQIQLISMLDPETASDVVVSHQLFSEQAGGAFPRWVMAGMETGIMQGDPTALIIANAWAFGARNYVPDPLFKLMRRSAETYGLKCQGVEVRPHLQDYLEKGYKFASLQLTLPSAVLPSMPAMTPLHNGIMRAGPGAGRIFTIRRPGGCNAVTLAATGGRLQTAGRTMMRLRTRLITGWCLTISGALWT